MAAPNLLRVGTAEKIFVECQDCTNNHEPFDVEIRVLNHPGKALTLGSTSLTLNNTSKFQGFGQIIVMFNFNIQYCCHIVSLPSTPTPQTVFSKKTF